MTLDVAIIGGEVIDGTGTTRRRADVGISDGHIVKIGELDEPASRTIDATGRVVTPGFIDVHTHYDAQVMWDGFLTPSPFHGVTTVLSGNCGFTLAPMSSSSAPYLQEMLARVEGMALSSLHAGLNVRWETFGEYLEAIDGKVALNIGFLVGHSAVRTFVLGDDWRREATDQEVEEMARTVGDSLAAGALGLSSSWGETHSDAAGDPVPSRFASKAELLRLCTVLREHPGTWLEFIPRLNGPLPEEGARMMAEMSAAAGRPLNWNLLTVRPDMTDEIIESRLAASDIAEEIGGAVYALTMPIPVALRLNLETGYLFDVLPTWRKVLALPRDHKLSELRKVDVRRVLVAEAEGSDRSWYDMERLAFDESNAAIYQDVRGRTVAEAARARGVDPFDLLFDVAVDDGLRTVFVVVPDGDDPESWQRRAALWQDSRTIIGGSDAGAHLDILNTFGFFTDFIGTSVRDRQLLTLEEAVRMVTGAVADAFGLRGRGRLEVGYAADVVVFDPAEVAPLPVEVRTDFPANGLRLYGEAKGIDAVLVNGVVVVEQGKLTGDRPGTVLRSGVDTETVAVAFPR